jgi:hypothetical protein
MSKVELREGLLLEFGVVTFSEFGTQATVFLTLSIGQGR